MSKAGRSKEGITFSEDNTLGDGRWRMCMGDRCFPISSNGGSELMKDLKDAVREGKEPGMARINMIPSLPEGLAPELFRLVQKEIIREDERKNLRREGVRQREIDEKALPGAWIWSSQSSDLLGLMGVNSRVLQVLGIYKKDCEGKTKWKYPDVLLRKFELDNTGINNAIWSLGIGWFMLNSVREDGHNIEIETAIGNRPILEEASLRFGLTKTAPVIGLEGEFVNLTGKLGESIVDGLLRRRVGDFAGVANKIIALKRDCGDRICRSALSYDQRFMSMFYWCEVMASQCQRCEEVIWSQFGNNRDILK